MTVKIVYKQPADKAHEVTDAMIEAIIKRHVEGWQGNFHSANAHLPIEAYRKAMEAARVAEAGEIERIEIEQENLPPTIHITPRIWGVHIAASKDGKPGHKFYDAIGVTKEYIRPLAEALLLLDKQINGGKEELKAEPKEEAHVHDFKHVNRGHGDTYFCKCGYSY